MLKQKQAQKNNLPDGTNYQFINAVCSTDKKFQNMDVLGETESKGERLGRFTGRSQILEIKNTKSD